MSASQYAEHRGCSDSFVRRMRRQQRLVVNDGGFIDAAASDALLAESSDPVRGGDRSTRPASDQAVDVVPAASAVAEPAENAAPLIPAKVDAVSLREAMRRERVAKARHAELELGAAAGELVRLKAVERLVFTMARHTLEQLRSMGSRLRGQLAAESDARKCEALIDAEVAKISADMQRTARELADTAISETKRSA